MGRLHCTAAMEVDEEFNEKSSHHTSSSFPQLTASRESLTDAESKKAHEILDACRWRNISQLQALAESRGGFLTDILRQQACKCCSRVHASWPL